MAAIQSGSAALANESSLALPVQADSNIELTLQNASGVINPTGVLQVFVGPQDACCDGKSPIAGRYLISDSTLIFDPAFDFVTDQRYTIATGVNDANNKATRELREFTIRPASETLKPEVVMIYPSASTLPENTLRFYIHFSTPMKPHLSADFIKLVGADGKADTTAFMKFKQELWSADRKRLTLLMDPGRIKRGVAQNLTLGPALSEGSTYSIVIEDGWPSANGGQKAPGFKKSFSVTPALRTLPDTKRWRVEPPETSTLDPLVIEFDQPFDYQLAQSSILVLNAAGDIIPGTVLVGGNEKIWHFHPERAWRESSVQLVIDAQLEDVAGNNFKDLLDHSVETDVKRIEQVRLTVKLM